MAKANIKSVIPNKKFNNTEDTLTSYHSHYHGFVQTVDDSTRMGRLSVWIPSINKDPSLGTFNVSYCSPFAGANQNNSQSSQHSYGFWACPLPGDQVVVVFLDGDPNRGVWIGCLYQQYMNHMVPGIGDSDLTTKGTGPSLEYDKSSSLAKTSIDPPRPSYTPLADGLSNQGLSGDASRGTSTSSARRDTASKVYGMLSPDGSQFVMDDLQSNQFIRLRTKSGTQVLVNEDIGYVYVISKNGNSWMELSDDGIDVYTSKLMSFRSQKDMNFHSDGNINMFSTGAINIQSMFNIGIVSSTNLDIKAGGHFSTNVNGQISMSAGGALQVSSDGDMGFDSGGDVAIRGCDNVGISSCSKISIKSGQIMLNSGDPVVPGNTIPAKTKDLSYLGDVELNPKNGYPAIKTQSNVSRLPTHEPFAGHPTSSTASPTVGINDNISKRVSSTVDGNNIPSASSSDTKSGDQPQNSDTSTSNNTKNSDWWIPVSGTVTSPFADTTSSVHSKGHDGVDIGAPQNSTIISSRAGKVVFSGSGGPGSGYNGYGNCVLLDHGDGFKTMYGHMLKTGCSTGDQVTQGQTIGFVGSTGHSTGNHCHFEIRQGANKINPGNYIPVLKNKLSRVKAGKQTV